MPQYNFKVGDRVKFKEEYNYYMKNNGFPEEFVIGMFDDENMNDDTVASNCDETVYTCLFRLELVETKPYQGDIQEAIDTLIKAGYKVTLSKE